MPSLHASHTASKRPATCSGISEHVDYTRHNEDTQTQICSRPTKDTLTADSLTANRFTIINNLKVRDRMTLNKATVGNILYNLQVQRWKCGVHFWSRSIFKCLRVAFTQF